MPKQTEKYRLGYYVEGERTDTLTEDRRWRTLDAQLKGLFEVLELNKDDKVDVYLYYRSNFYYIKDKTDSITPLKSVSDNGLKLKLESLR